MPTPLQIKGIIVDISGLTGNPANLQDSTKLSELKYNGFMCTNLENTLRNMTTKTIPFGSVTSGKTVIQIVNLVI